MNTLLLICTLVLSALIVIHVVNVINCMNKKTHIEMKIAFIVVGIGALASMLAPFFGRPMSWTNVALMAGLIMLYVFERRRPSSQTKARQHDQHA